MQSEENKQHCLGNINLQRKEENQEQHLQINRFMN
jgi:hypothetical protein